MANRKELWFTKGTVAETKLIADFGRSGSIRNILPVGNSVYFVGEKNFGSVELWVNHGTENEVIQLTNRDLTFSQSESIINLIVLGDRVIFSAYAESHGMELWITDGTEIGTHVLKDINIGEESSSPSNFFIFNQQLIFKAYTQETGMELWTTNGTEEGTVLLKDIRKGEDSSMNVSVGYQVYKDNFYFFADDGINGYELWKSNGTSNGTNLFKNINEGTLYDGSGSTMKGGVLNDKLIFFANDGIHGEEIWQTDGTEEGTNLLTESIEGTATSFGSGLSEFVFSKKKAFFNIRSYHDENDGLWVSDGTEDGTQLIKNVLASHLTFDSTEESIYFFGSGDSYFNKPLWKSDGTPEGTKMVSDTALSSNISSHENDIILLNEKVFFAGETEFNGVEMWKYDEDKDETSFFYDFNHVYGVSPTLLTPVGDKLFFRGNKEGTFDLLTSDGTSEGTRYLTINTEGQGVDDESEFINFNGKLVVSANDGVHGYELWISDGTVEGTKMIRDINPGSASSMYNEEYLKTFTVINDKLYFMADDGVHGFELWATDGTEEGTYRITDIAKGSGNRYDSNPQNLVWYKDMIYFSSFDGGIDAIYKTDGSSSNVSRVVNIKRLESISVINDKLIIVANTSDTTYGPHDIWVSDGTSKGTSHLMSFGDGIDSSIRLLTILNDELYFIARYPNPRYESFPEFSGETVYKTDGTTEGTIPLFIGSEHSIHNPDVNNLITCGEYVYFGVGDSFNVAKELWRTDGTAEGTLPIVTQQEGVINIIEDIECYRDNVVFRQYAYPEKLWITNGDPSNVNSMDFNIINGSLFSRYSSLTTVGDKLFFEGTSDKSGSEIYVTSPLEVRSSENFVDEDQDGVIDIFDECPNTLQGNEVNKYGCANNQLDDDKDGVTNDKDECPQTPVGEEVDTKGCSESSYLDEDNDGVNDTLDKCFKTPVDEIVNDDGCSQTQLDDDEDGVMNDKDICPETLPLYPVDENGCPLVFDLPSNNFTIETTGITCEGKNNGRLLIRASESYNYVAKVNDDSYNFTTELSIENLYAGYYDLCITIPEQTDFKKCFKFYIPNASTVSGKSTAVINEKGLSERIEMLSGTAPYSVVINGEKVLVTMSSAFSIEVKHGDLLQIYSKFHCEGTFEKRVQFENAVSVSPNPTHDYVFVDLPKQNDSDITVRIYNLNYQLIESSLYTKNNETLKIDMRHLSSGVYYVQIGSRNSVVHKIVKR
ncbi:T9SS type A sorting domain-containing protein [Galbibacter mesophilus]|uniref:T9SS type A sorting domain-containing protein n=1 Tax=Galbibacter mesophilus TaxID=379069 RepID=UPI0019202A15|nr:T9SS type A sorting domain-containing protein [Galbibacter mesophilus]MCM5662802.1 T9SS type A sorting domain-containing protein [Galbibacter mesophilus]